MFYVFSQMHLPTNIASPKLYAILFYRIALGKILGDFPKFLNSFPLPQVKRSVTILI